MNKKHFFLFLYIIFDYLSAGLTWACFFIFRKQQIEADVFFVTNKFWLGILTMPIFWLIIYLFQGTYHKVRRKYRLKVISQTFSASFIGVIIIFFILLLDDVILFHYQYYTSALTLFALQFIITITPRFIITSLIVLQVHKKKIKFDSIIIGGGIEGEMIYEELNNLNKCTGNHFIGFINIKDSNVNLKDKIPLLGNFNQINEILQNKQNIEEVVIALEKGQQKKLQKIISILQGYPLQIKLVPNMYNIIAGKIKMTTLLGRPLVEVNSEIMPYWQQIIKRMIDIVGSFIFIILLIPFYLIIALLVKSSSKGTIFFLQERIGKMGKPFKIIKFRTMYSNAEKLGPQLSSSNDSRITPIGKFLRKTRFDEFPQFLNVLKGDMSLVGPRPEREFYINEIIKYEPQYRQLNKLRPGITSWGQVKYGYAENVKEMLQRMKFDFLYLKNMTLAMDFKIMFYTIIVMLLGKGK